MGLPRVRRWLVLSAALAAIMALPVLAAGGDAGAGGAPRLRELRLSLMLPRDDGPIYGEVAMLALDDGSAAAARQIAEGRAAMLARFPGAVEVPRPEASAQFRLHGIRWHQVSASWLYNPAGGPPALAPELAEAAILAGSEAWDGAGDTAWHFESLGTTTVAPGCNGLPGDIPADGHNVVGWGHIASGFLGYSCWWHGDSLVPGTPYFESTEFDIVFEPLVAYSSASLQALAMHEFGHALGLDHAEQELCPGAAMCAGDDAMRFTTPQDDDINGLVALYGRAPTPPPAPPSSTPRALLPAVSRD